jgi:hypothetical protein
MYLFLFFLNSSSGKTMQMGTIMIDLSAFYSDAECALRDICLGCPREKGGIDMDQGYPDPMCAGLLKISVGGGGSFLKAVDLGTSKARAICKIRQQDERILRDEAETKRLQAQKFFVFEESGEVEK